MSGWLSDRVREIQDRLAPDDEGALWVVLFDDPHGPPIMAAAVKDAIAEMTDRLLRNLVGVIDEVPTKAVLFAIPRASMYPTEADLRFWQEVQKVFPASTELLDLVIVGAGGCWSARESLA